LVTRRRLHDIQGVCVFGNTSLQPTHAVSPRAGRWAILSASGGSFCRQRQPINRGLIPTWVIDTRRGLRSNSPQFVKNITSRSAFSD
jgi:hypothetical protein